MYILFSSVCVVCDSRMNALVLALFALLYLLKYAMIHRHIFFTDSNSCCSRSLFISFAFYIILFFSFFLSSLLVDCGLIFNTGLCADDDKIKHIGRAAERRGLSLSRFALTHIYKIQARHGRSEFYQLLFRRTQQNAQTYQSKHYTIVY